MNLKHKLRQGLSHLAVHQNYLECLFEPWMFLLELRPPESDSWQGGRLESIFLANSSLDCYAHRIHLSIPWCWEPLSTLILSWDLQGPWPTWLLVTLIFSSLHMVGIARSQGNFSVWTQLIGLRVDTWPMLGYRVLSLGFLDLEPGELHGLPFMVWVVICEAISPLPPYLPSCGVEKGRKLVFGERRLKAMYREKHRCQREEESPVWFKSLVLFVLSLSFFLPSKYTYIIFPSCISWFEQHSCPTHQRKHS